MIIAILYLLKQVKWIGTSHEAKKMSMAVPQSGYTMGLKTQKVGFNSWPCYLFHKIGLLAPLNLSPHLRKWMVTVATSWEGEVRDVSIEVLCLALLKQ